MKIDLNRPDVVELKLLMTVAELQELSMMMHQVIASAGWREASQELAGDILDVIEKFTAKEIQ